ncbi:polyprenyl synthetase family protein [Xanthobacter sp. V4C-4]|uniref:polyprenyl synthetase family protein n=1 Tax=Xanthobacter cornucopiae TaxID=3119924 RepID=UPI0037285291
MTQQAGRGGGADDARPVPPVDAQPAPEGASEDRGPVLRSRELTYLRAVVDRRLGLLVPPPSAHPAALHAAMRHILLAPGKRLRPLLALAAALQLDVSEHAVLDFGCALEMIHAASLIIDDLPCMDDAAMRRAQPTTHVQFGEDVALLAAVALLSRAFGVAADAPVVPPQVRLDAVAALSLAVGSLGLCGGQFDDLRPAPGRTVKATEDVNRRKTGVLFIAAAEIAGRVAGVDEDRGAHLKSFAAHVGRAYQILDDILDATASSASLGKDVGKDVHKATLIAELGTPRARKLLVEHLASAANASRLIGANAEGHEPLRLFLQSAFGELAPERAP